LSEATARFLAPDYERDTHDPFLMPDMDRAVARILLAMEQGERIAVYGDFDCDGIPGAALLHQVFHKLGHSALEVYIPHRDEEGYGFHAHAIDILKERGVTLIITVDVGTTAVESVAHAKKLGIDVIVTDHHEIPNALPECIVINPKRAAFHRSPAAPFEYGISVLENSSTSARQPAEVLTAQPVRDASGYPFPGLSGTGVAFKVAQALMREGKKRGMERFIAIPDGWEKWLLDLVAIATIADMMPLIDENRTLVYWGLRVLRKTKRPGLRALASAARLQLHDTTEDDIGFSIAPRINAASRMGTPELAFRLLSTEDAKEAEQLASELEKLNTSRKAKVASIVKEAKKRMHARFTPEDVVAVLGDPEWKPGLLGLVATSLLSGRKGIVCVWGRDAKGKLKGSCRTDGSVSVVELFSRAEHVLEEWGGHHASGGFTVSPEGVHTLADVLAEVRTQLPAGEYAPERTPDATIAVREANWALYADMAQLAPYGAGNPKPVLRIQGTIVDMKPFGKEKNHIELTLACDDTGRTCRAFEFFKTAQDFAYPPTQNATVVVTSTLERDSFRGRSAVALRLISVEQAQ
jgi:single-stranded-DNA-specific exonuclease